MIFLHSSITCYLFTGLEHTYYIHMQYYIEYQMQEKYLNRKKGVRMYVRALKR
jgi:hypothetical protein